MSQDSPQQQKAQTLELGLAKYICSLLPYKPDKEIRPSPRYKNNRLVDEEPNFKTAPSSQEMEVIREAVEGFERLVGPICRDRVKKVSLGDQSLLGDRRDVIVSYVNGSGLSFDIKGVPGRPDVPVDITSPRSKALFDAVGHPGVYKSLTERLAQRDFMLEALKEPRALGAFVGKVMGKYDYHIMDVGRKTTYPWGPSLANYHWVASESEVEFRQEMYPSILLYCQEEKTSIEICPRRKCPRGKSSYDPHNFKWHTICSGAIVKAYDKMVETPEDLF